VFLWDAKKGDLIEAIQEGTGTALSRGSCILAFTPDGEYLLTASRGLNDDLGQIYVRKRDATTGKLVARMKLTQPGERFPYVYPRAIAPDGRSLASIGESGDGRENSPYESSLAIYDLGQLFGAAMSPARPVKP
jgi:WD40 repeat protein